MGSSQLVVLFRKYSLIPNYYHGSWKARSLHRRRCPVINSTRGREAFKRFLVSHPVQVHPLSLTSRIYSPDASAISDPTIRSVAEKFLGVGETIFDMVQATAVNSSYFKRSN